VKVDEVPQDRARSYEGASKVCYAVDAAGKIVKTPTSGWIVEEWAMSIAWDAMGSTLDRIRGDVLAGKASPLAWFMTMRQMDVRLLAQNLGTFAWRVGWHLRPKVFTRLSQIWISRYADCLDVPVESLRDPAAIPESRHADCRY
jgi:hypothetical protein